MMKKLLAAVLALVMCLSVTTAWADDDLLGGMAGGWTLPEDIAVPEDAQQALEEALEGFVGSQITPVALLGTQVVAGINYCLLCRETLVIPNAEPSYVMAYVYKPLDGPAELTDLIALSLDQYQDTWADDYYYYNAFLLDSVGTMDMEEGATELIYCLDGWLGNLTVEGGETDDSFTEWTRLVLTPDFIAFVPASAESDEVAAGAPAPCARAPTAPKASSAAHAVAVRRQFARNSMALARAPASFCLVIMFLPRTPSSVPS